MLAGYSSEAVGQAPQMCQVTEINTRGRIIKSMQSFLIFFYILDYCYKKCEEDHLGGFLGAISPELWGNGRPIDIAIYNDWKKQNTIQDLNEKSIMEATYKFTTYYQEEWGFCFPETKKILYALMNDKVESEELVEQAKKYAENMYREYNYDD